MSNIKLLDCTLRDGGYLNDWNYGNQAIKDICRESAWAGSNVIELGFLRDVSYHEDFCVFNQIKQIAPFLYREEVGPQYAVMCEALNPLPAEKIPPREKNDVEIIRVIVWKRLLDEGFEYCKQIVEKGYRLCVQPNRVDQYSQEEFKDTVCLFNQLSPMAFYVVDSFGVLDEREILRYGDIAHEFLKKDIALGYHGHNNLMQAYGSAQGLIERRYDRQLMIDASVYGIGRGAGNLNIELMAKYLNENQDSRYKLEHYMNIYLSYVKSIYEKRPWGYSYPHFLTALHRCNPMYGDYYWLDKKLSPDVINQIIQQLSEEDKIRFSRKKADFFYEQYVNAQK